ncbi:uncharacterized protein LOC107786938 [Nicotiana tabacum]|uniref:Uncharacterized protein LOC107786938 n=2 Tax=Nicotiana TaxID=4085 RepID=A0A1S3ZHM7_TOBAC|nr:PREDICTED: uncharacterized protein LOC104247199 [Nicotiana sylvestris]XP_016463938.1 PREDICTED: uncharacterized protein LOC107786938 [Nicotiana tabacum]
MVGTQPSKNNQEYRKTLFCNYCKKEGHTIDKYFKLHGYPRTFKNSNRQNKFQYSIQGNAVFSDEGPGQFQTNISETEATIGINQGQLTQLMELQVKIGQKAPIFEASVVANCAGPFLEEASGSW